MAVEHQLAVQEILFESADDRRRLERAVDEGEYESQSAFIREATLRLIDDVIDADGPLECPHDDCDRTFATRRQLRGHLGSSDHALDVPDGDFWCGYCGFGPTSWRGVNGHHGSSSHDGDPIRMRKEPERDDLVAPEDIPDHKNPELLERLYREYGGNYTEMCRQHDFDVTDGRVRHYLIEFGIHEAIPHGASEDRGGPANRDRPAYRDREWLQERYDAADGNISEMHRRIEAEGDVDVPYRTLLKNLKNLGIHDPMESPGRTQASNRRDAGEEDVAGGVEDDPDEEETFEEKSAVDEQPDDEPAVESFDDLATPDWLDEGSFYAAVDMAADIDDLATTLGWPEHERLESMVDQLDVRLGGGAQL